MIPRDAFEIVEHTSLAFVATVGQDGAPNLSPKGSLLVRDEHRLVFGNINSPQTIANLLNNPRVAVNVVHPIRRRGYRFEGVARVTNDADLVDFVTRDLDLDYGIEQVIVVDVMSCGRLDSPRSTMHGATEPEMIDIWSAHFAPDQAGFDVDAFSDEYLTAWQDHDIERILALHTPDTEYQSPAFGRHARGRAEVADALAAVFTVWPDLRFDVHRVHAATNHIVTIATAHATQAVPVTTGETTIEPTGMSVAFDVVDVFDIHDGLVASKLTMLDALAYTRAMSVAPIP